MTELEKIRKVLEVKGISFYEANRQLGFGGGTLNKMAERGGGWHPSTKAKFLRHFGVNPAWWETGKGEMLNEKGTEVPETLNKVEEEAMKYVSPLVETQLKLIKSQEELIDLLRAEVKGLREQLRVLSEKPGA